MLNTPLAFTPLLKVRVWGGDALKGRAPNAPVDPIGESWELADHGADTSVVAKGPHAGWSLRELMAEEREALCGEAIDPASPGVFPLLLKLLDPREDLSVQVHPDDIYAGRHKAGELGKTEAWYVLERDPGAKIYKGLRPEVDREHFAAALAEGGVADCLEGFAVEPGEVIYIPAGMVHALGAGVRVAEIQQNSDTTYRVFDWNRVGLDGKPRALHIEHALAVTDYANREARRATPSRLATQDCIHERFIACEKFHFERLSRIAAEGVQLSTEKRRFHILTVVAGSITVECPGGSLTRERWETALLPAAVHEYRISATSDAVVLLFYRP